MYADAFGAAGFWLAVAVMIVAVVWSRSRREQMKHETLRQIVEKTGHVDGEQLKTLLQPPTPAWSHHAWGRVPEPGGGFRALRIIGVLTLFLAAAIATVAGFMFAIVLPGHSASIGVENDVVPVFAIAAGIAVLGCGLFFCSRFLPKPQPEASGRSDRT